MPAAHILIADDNRDLLFVLSEVLRSAGYHVSEAADREQANRILCDGGVDLLITDSILSGEVRNPAIRNTDLPVIVMSGDPDRIWQSGNSPFPLIAKPFNRPDLLFCVSQALEKTAKE